MLRRLAVELLPPTHVPSSIVVVPALPRTDNGKIDRSALAGLSAPTPPPIPAAAIDATAGEDEASGAETGEVAAEDPTLRKVRAIWSRCFDGRAVAADDDFFDMGGDSLRAVELVGQLEAAFGRRVAIGELIDAPTPSLIADRLRPAEEAPTPAQPTPERAEPPAIPVIETDSEPVASPDREEHLAAEAAPDGGPEDVGVAAETEASDDDEASLDAEEVGLADDESDDRGWTRWDPRRRVAALTRSDGDDDDDEPDPETASPDGPAEPQPDEVAAAAAETRLSDGLVEWLRSSGDETPLVVLPPGGGNLLRYAPLVRALDRSIPVVGVRLPGADARSATVEGIEAQAAVMLESLDRAMPSGPYRLLGWSTGGLIAWEMARLLQDRGDDVQFVGLIDTLMGGMSAEETRTPLEKYSDLLDEGGVRAVFDEGFGRVRERAQFGLARRRYRTSREKGATPDMADAERHLGPVIRRAAASYAPQPLDVPLLYLAASESGTELTIDPWTALQAPIAPLDVVTIEGTHYLPEETCIGGPGGVDELVAALLERLPR